MEMKTAITAILHEEVGCGDVALAHERVYVSTMVEVGFTEDEVARSVPYPETRELIEAYESFSAHPLDALGFVYATEVADLKMVSGIGQGVRRVTGARKLLWVDIHVRQEPGHVHCATSAVLPVLEPAEEERVLASADEMWRRWVVFFTRLHRVLEDGVPRPAAAV
jgi:pyrroloquinoline quinone (PQQ) biosynthesis protein C